MLPPPVWHQIRVPGISLTNLGTFKRPLEHSFRGCCFFGFLGFFCLFFSPLSAFVCKSSCWTDEPFSSLHPSFLHSSPSQFSHPIYSLQGTQSYIVLLLPLVMSGRKLQLQRQPLLGQPAAWVKARQTRFLSQRSKRPTSHFTFVVTCLFRQAAAIEGSFWHCLTSL